MPRINARDAGSPGSPRLSARTSVPTGPVTGETAALRMQRLCVVHSMLLALSVTLGYLAALESVGAPARIAIGVVAMMLAGTALKALWSLHDRVNQNWLDAAIPRRRR